jgi:TonB-linked SusC/RagA family outer membrane protein
MKHFLLTLCMLFVVTAVAVAQRTIVGTVVSDDGEALVGASIRLKGANVGTTTNIEGKFSIQVPSEGSVLSISYTGYDAQEVSIGASNLVNITLKGSAVLTETVVTALGISREERSLGYSTQVVESDKLARSGETNLVQALAGKAAGVQVTGSTGMAGASSFFLIRGANSIDRDNQPLIVVDGVPIDNSQNTSSDQGGNATLASVAYSNRGIDINPNEIESVNILKGAAATAIYGSLAGNGAIIITTKRGKIGVNKLSVDFSSNLQFSEVSQLPALQSTYAQGVGGGYRGPSTGFAGSWGPLLSDLVYDGTANNPWDKNGNIVKKADNPTGKAVTPYNPYDFFQTGLATVNNLGISSSNSFGSLRFSVGYTDQEGIVPNNTFKKLNLGLNAEAKLSEKWRLSTGVQYINSGGTRIEQGSNVSGVMLSLLRTPPTFDNSNGLSDAANNPESYTFPDGRQRTYRGYGIYDNPYWTVNNNPLKDNVNRVIANVQIGFSPTKWLDLTYRPSIDYYNDARKQFFAIGSSSKTPGQVFLDQYNSRVFNADAVALFKPNLGDNWAGSTFTLSQTMYANKLDRFFVQGDNLVLPNFYDISNASSVLSVADNSELRQMRGSAILDLAYRRMLYLGASYTLEGNTSLPEDNATYGYYGLNSSFVFSELMKNKSKIFSFGKVRASYGLVGLGTAAFATRTTYRSATFSDGWTDGIKFPFNGTGGYDYNSLLGNGALQPERRRQWEVGTDLRFFQNRVGLDVSYYQSRSFDIIIQTPITGSTGAGALYLNAAQMTNEGVELVLNATPVQTKNFSWDFQTNFTRNRNSVDKLADGVDQVFLGGFTGASVRAVVDQPYGSIFGFGFYKDASGATVVGSDGYPILDLTEKAFNTSLPDFQIGINNSFTYKGFTVAGLLDIKQGGVVWNGTQSALYFFGTAQESADLRGTDKVFAGNVASYDADGNLVLYDHDNDAKTPNIPRTEGANSKSVTLGESWLRTGDANGFFGNNTEDFIEDASWVRLRDVSISWALPQKWMQNARIQNASISLSGRNLWLRTPYEGVDPETNLTGATNAQGLDYFNMPNTKSYSVGLNVKF